MIVCTLTTPQKQILFQTVSADILSMVKSGTPFNLNNYVKDIFNLMKKGGFDDGTALAYASLVPQNIKMLIGMDSSIDDYLEPAIGEIFQAAKKMSDVDFSMKYVGLVSGGETEGGKEAENELELDELKKKNAVKANTGDNGTFFSAKPNNLNTTTGNSQEVGREHSYGFISYAIDNDFLNSASSGYYISLMNASDVVRDNDTSNKAMQSGLVQVITDKFGVPLYFDNQYVMTDSANGRPVFFRLRGGESEFTKALTSLQTMNELVKTLGIEDTEIISAQLKAQHDEIQKKKKYVEGGAGRRIVQEITGASSGMVVQLRQTDSPNRLPLGNAQDLSGGSISIKQTPGKQKNLQTNFFVRGDHKKPIQFSMNTVESLGNDFLNDAADILLGKYVQDGEVVPITDEFGNADNENLITYRTTFRYVFFGNNKTLSISKTGDVYIGEGDKKVKVSDNVAEAKEQILSALKNHIRTGQGHAINIFDEIKDFIPFFERSSKGLSLKKNGMSNTQYKKFVQKNSYTFSKYDDNGQFVEVNGYFTFRTSLEEMNRIDAEALKPAKPAETKEEKAPEATAPVTSEVAIPTIEELNDDLDILSDLDTPDYKAPDDKTLNKLKAQGKVNPEVTEEEVQAAKKWYTSHPMSKYISYNEMFDIINAENPESIAQFSRDAITLYKGSNSTDVYHEAWHGFTQRFLTEKERKEMYAEVGKMKGSFTDYNGKTVEFSKADDIQIEEYLAEDFRKFMLSGGKMPKTAGTKVKSIFEKILDVLKVLFGYDLTDGFSNNQASFSLNDIYNNLKIGNIRPTPFAFEKTQPESLNKINPVSERYKSLSETLSYSDAMEVVDSLDSFFSEHSDLANRVNGTSEFTSTLLSNPKERANAYNGALLRVIKEYKDTVSLRKEASKTGTKDDYDRLLRKEKILEFVIANFSPKSTKGQTITAQDIIDAEKSNTGIIAYHMQKSKYLTFEDRFQIEDIEEKVKDDKDGYSHKAGNEKSMKELASTEVLYTIRSLFEYDKDGNPVKNTLGFNKLMRFDTAWNRIQQILEDKFDITEQYQARSEAGVKDPMIRQLISKLGNPNRYADANFTDQSKADKTGIIMQNNLWTNFRNALGGRRIPLVQLTIDIITDRNSKDVTEIQVKPGKAQADTNKIARDFDAAFSSPVIISSRQRYIKTKPKDATVKELEKFRGNELIINNVVEDFEKTYASDPVNFLRALGMEIPDGPEMKKILTSTLSILPKALMDKLLYIKKYNDANPPSKKSSKPITINSVSELIDLPLNGKTERGGYNELLRSVAKYSDTYGSSMVSTAAGAARWELSLRSTASQMIDSWNSADSYADLISRARMSHLDVTRNPHIQGLILTRDAFGDDLSSKSVRIKRSGRQRQAGIELLNSSGVALLSDGDFTGLATDSVEADEITQTLQNFYSYVIYGVSEGTRHADKSTSYWYKIKFANGNKHFIPINEFANYSRLDDPKEDAATTDGMRTAVNQFMRYISGEVSRINKLVNENDASGDVLVGDRTFKEVGSDFVIFEDVLGSEIREQIKSKHLSNNFYDQLTTDPKLAQLKTDIENSVTNYIREQVDAFKNDLEKINLLKRGLMMKSLRSEITSATGISSKIKNNPDAYTEFVDEALINGYVVNDWIQKFETTALLYGDPALYNHIKEEFHKRNAGIAATGTIPRSDEAMNALLNGAMAGRYINSEWFKASGMTATQPVNSGILNSAILEDTKTASVYTEDYINAAIEYEKKRRGVKKLDADTLAEITEAFSEYTKMKEGDAQGWITFDSYRALLNRLGKWSPYQEDMYNQIMDGKTVSTAELSKFFPIKKMQYWGPLKTDSGIPVMAFHKFSLMPLIPTVVKGTNLEVLHNKMVSQNIDYATFQSGSKISTITTNGEIDKFYENKSGKDRSIPAFAKADYAFTPNPIFLDYMKDQLEIADDYKGKVIFSTQLRKLIEIGLMEHGIPTDFEPKEKNVQKRIVKWTKALSEGKSTRNYDMLLKYEGLVAKLTEYKKRELEREADVKYNANGVAVLSDKLLQFVKDELTRQDLAEHEIDFIKFDDQKGELVYDLSLHPSADRIERLLTAMVYKRLIRQKINGEALIQVSGVGFEPANIRKATEEEKDKYGTNFLPFYRKKADGTTAAMKVKIAIQGDFKKLLKHPDVIKLAKERKITSLQALNELIRDENWLDKGENRQMLTISGVRIPVQGINSMEFAEVYEFLPENAGNMIILPTEIVGKSGSDFDIDKLTMMFPSIVATSKGVSIVKYDSKYEGQEEARREKLDELYKKKDEIQDRILNLVKREEEEGTISVRKDIKDAIDKLKKQRTDLIHQLSYDIENFDPIHQSIDSINEQLNELFEGLYNISAAVKKIKTDELDPIIDAIDNEKVAIASGSSKGIENDLLNTVVDILRLEQNFTELVTPNSTNLLTPLAERYSIKRDYNSYATLNNNGESYMHNGKKRISATRVFELGYNRYKQISNNLGKKTLGLGAVDNTYNSIFNRVNFYLNPYFEMSVPEGDEWVDYAIRQTIRMPHNSIKLNGNDAVSLASLYDVNNKNNIAKIISQMINGWVDVAKDPWIFDIQGNIEVSPTLLFMIQAGVPLDQAVAFVSQPVVKRYVEKQRFMKSTFGVTMGVSPTDAKQYRSSARREILKEMGLAKYGDLSSKNQKRTLYTKIIPAVLETAPDNEFDLNKLDSRIMDTMVESEVPM